MFSYFAFQLLSFCALKPFKSVVAAKSTLTTYYNSIRAK